MWFKKIFLFLLLTIFIFCPIAISSATETISNSLGVTPADIILIIETGGIIVIVALDARIALMLGFILYASTFVIFTLAPEAGYTGFDPYFPGVAFMGCFVLMALSLLITYKKSNTPGNMVV
jgi:hypothetical protein